MKIKKSFAVVLILALLMQTVCVAFGEDIENHWSYKATSYLSDNGIISGDANGNLNLENDITRAEFIKIINKSFGYTEKDEENFLDVKEDAWYYDELLAAKKAGYIKGDDNGNANPDSDITRNEASVILGRILGLEEITDASYFTDTDIPDWAIGYVNALKKENLINGYEDGSFKGNATIKRAEAFQMLYNTKMSNVPGADPSPGNDNNKVESTPITFTPPSVSDVTVRPSGGGGGGGGGGGAGGGGGYISTPTTVETPVILSFDTTAEEITVAEVANASKFKIKLTSLSADTYIETTDASAQTINLSSEIFAATSIGSDAKIEYEISVMAIAQTGYVDSPYCEKVIGEKAYPSLDTPEPAVTVSNSAGKRVSAVTWPEVTGASDYTATVAYSDGTAYANWTLDAANRQLNVNDMTTNATADLIVKIKAISSTPGIRNSQEAEVTCPLQIRDDDAYCVYDKYEFATYAGLDMDMKLMEDITLGAATVSGGVVTVTESWTSIAAYSADFDGNNKAITIYGNSGIFTKITGNVSNLVIKGEIVSTGGMVGALASDMTADSDGCIVDNVTNYANVKGGGSNTVGGIIAQATSTNYAVNLYAIRNCKNYGNVGGSGINALSFTGGIIGTTRAAVINCANFGNVTGSAFTGGIAGRTRSSIREISGCYNAGTITGSAGDDTANSKGGTAGIVGGHRDSNANGFIIKNCYNAGEINQESGVTSAGIISTIADTMATDIKIQNCYNVGAVNNTNGICGVGSNTLNYIEVSNSYYLGTGTSTLSGATAKTDDEMKAAAMVNLLNGDAETPVFAVPASGSTYLYPVIIGNEQI